MEYTKPYLPVKDQLSLLISRGLNVEDRDFATQKLTRISYYRLSDYCIPFQSPKDIFDPGTTLKSILNLYNFDHELRVLLIDVL